MSFVHSVKKASSFRGLLPWETCALSSQSPGMGNGAPGRKAHGGGKGRKNKDHRLHTLQRTIHKNRWDDICATELKVENYDRVVAEKTKLDPDLPGLGQYYCVACRHALPCTLSCTLPCTSTIDPHLSCGLHVDPPSSLLSMYFVSDTAMADHLKTAKHRRRENKLRREKIYDAAEANAAAGRGPPDNGLRASTDVAVAMVS